MLEKIQEKVAACFPFNTSVEILLGCILYQYHPIQLKTIFYSFNVDQLFNAKEKYEYELKKNTILIHTV